MQKLLSIIIPYYNESFDKLVAVLSSINIQVGIDKDSIEVILVNDGGNSIHNYVSLSAFSNLHFNHIDLTENKGAGVARQAGIDAATGGYIMFCDADDVLYSVDTLCDILRVVSIFVNTDLQKPADIINTTILEERLMRDGSSIFMSRKDEVGVLHGRVYRRGFLLEKNIRFHDEYRIYEDVYFTVLADALADNKITEPYVTYLWKFTTGSITRTNYPDYYFSTMPEYIEVIDDVFSVIESRRADEMPRIVCRFAVDIFLGLHRQDWEGYAEDRKVAYKAFEATLKKYRKYITGITKEKFRDKIFDLTKGINIDVDEATDAFMEQLAK